MPPLLHDSSEFNKPGVVDRAAFVKQWSGKSAAPGEPVIEKASTTHNAESLKHKEFLVETDAVNAARVAAQNTQPFSRQINMNEQVMPQNIQAAPAQGAVNIEVDEMPHIITALFDERNDLKIEISVLKARLAVTQQNLQERTNTMLEGLRSKEEQITSLMARVAAQTDTLQKSQHDKEESLHAVLSRKQGDPELVQLQNLTEGENLVIEPELNKVYDVIIKNPGTQKNFVSNIPYRCLDEAAAKKLITFIHVAGGSVASTDPYHPLPKDLLRGDNKFVKSQLETIHYAEGRRTEVVEATDEGVQTPENEVKPPPSSTE